MPDSAPSHTLERAEITNVATGKQVNEQDLSNSEKVSLGVYKQFLESSKAELLPTVETTHTSDAIVNSCHEAHSAINRSPIRAIELKVFSAVSPSISVFSKIPTVVLGDPHRLEGRKSPFSSPKKKAALLDATYQIAHEMAISAPTTTDMEAAGYISESVPADRIMTQKMLRDRALMLFTRFQSDLNEESEQAQRLLVASRYMEHLIDEMKLHASLISGIKSVYHEICEASLGEKDEIWQLKTQLLSTISKANEKLDAKHNLQETCKFLKYENENLQRQKAALEAQLKSPSRNIQASQESKSIDNGHLSPAIEDNNIQKMDNRRNSDGDASSATNLEIQDGPLTKVADTFKINVSEQEDVILDCINGSGSIGSLID